MTMPAAGTRGPRALPRPARPRDDPEFSPWAFIDALRDSGMTPKQLAEEMGASLDAIARWMAGIASPKPGYAKHAAEILDREARKRHLQGVNVEDFYE